MRDVDGTEADIRYTERRVSILKERPGPIIPRIRIYGHDTNALLVPDTNALLIPDTNALLVPEEERV